MRFARRMSRIGESATMAVARRALELREQGADVVDLGAGEPDFGSPQSAVEACTRALQQGQTKYTAVGGVAELRESLIGGYASRFGGDLPWSAADVVVTVGAKAALFELALAMFDEGDEVLVPTPCWVSIPEQVRLAGADVRLIELSAQAGFRLDVDDVARHLTPNTRGLVINSPCNPTGAMIDAETLQGIAALCAERNVLLVSDETYERFAYEREHASVAALAARFPENVALVGSFSKTFAMTGWRLGFLLAHPEIAAGVRAVQSHATSNATTFAMFGAAEVLREEPPEVKQMLDAYRRRRSFVTERLRSIEGVEVAAPDGAFYSFPDISGCFGQAGASALEIAGRALEEHHLAVVPGEAFGNPRHLRISFAASDGELVRGLDRLEAALRG